MSLDIFGICAIFWTRRILDKARMFFCERKKKFVKVEKEKKMVEIFDSRCTIVKSWTISLIYYVTHIHTFESKLMNHQLIEMIYMRENQTNKFGDINLTN